MSIYYMLAIAILSGAFGGTINYLLPANNPAAENPGDKTKPIDYLGKCVLLGIGATLMVPLFLELAKSQLMENITFEKSMVVTKPNNPLDTLRVVLFLDSSNKVAKSDTLKSGNFATKITIKKDLKSNKTLQSDTAKLLSKNPENNETNQPHDAAKNYLLWMSYCLIVATAGFRFINMLVSKVVTATEITTLQQKIETQKEKDRLNKIQNQRNQQADQIAAVNDITIPVRTANLRATEEIEPFVIPLLSPGTDPEDTQKGRFGGLAVRNDRKLGAKVTPTEDPDFFTVEITVENIGEKELESDVMFYLHNSFNRSIVTVSITEIKHNNGIAEYTVEAWGAFTVGAITDFGRTTLELDLSSSEINAPKKFRDR